jgi:hypothetical protein
MTGHHYCSKDKQKEQACYKNPYRLNIRELHFSLYGDFILSLNRSNIDSVMLSQKSEFLAKYPGIGWSTGLHAAASFSPSGPELHPSGPVGSKQPSASHPVWLGKSDVSSQCHTSSQRPIVPTSEQGATGGQLGISGKSTQRIPGPRANNSRGHGPPSMAGSLTPLTKQPAMGGTG